MVNLVKSREWFVVLCVAVRLLGGCGTAMISVGGNSLLLKSSSFKPATIMVCLNSIERIALLKEYFC